MPARMLTVQSVERIKSDPTKRVEVPDAALPGLYLVVQPSGAKSWAVRYRSAGKNRKHTLGSYPALDLLTARARGREALQAVAHGRDPGAEKQAIKGRSSVDDPDLLSKLAEEFLTRHVRAKNGERWAAEAERIIRRDLLPAWGSVRVQEISRRSVVELLDRVVDRGSPVMANRSLAVARKFFAWCIGRSILEANPCLGVKAPAAEVTRDRVLSDHELALVWRAAESLGWPFGPFIRLLILTAQRREEVGAMRWSEIKAGEGLWTIPSTRTKNKRVHDVPLSDVTQALLSTLPRIAGRPGYIFTTNGSTAASGYSKAKQRLDTIMQRLACEEADRDDVVIEPWRLHDLRRTAASGMARLGADPHVVESVLNHKSGVISGVAAVYNRYSYANEKKEILQRWGFHVEAIAFGKVC